MAGKAFVKSTYSELDITTKLQILMQPINIEHTYIQVSNPPRYHHHGRHFTSYMVEAG